MAVTHSAVASGGKPAIGTAIKNAIEQGAGVGVLRLMNAAKTVTYATMNLATPCGTVNATSGVLTFDCTPSLSDSSASAGTATVGRFTDSNGVVIMECSVAITGADINLSNNVFGAGDAVKISSLTYTPPS